MVLGAESTVRLKVVVRCMVSTVGMGGGWFRVGRFGKVNGKYNK